MTESKKGRKDERIKRKKDEMTKDKFLFVL